MNEAKITVIVPTYCVEDYIERCLDCLVNQSISAVLEVLVIDDASIDNTIQIIKDYSCQHKNIHLYNNTERKGPSQCRNSMLELVRTEYVAFLDADDWVDLDTYEKALCHSANNLDMVIWNIDTVWNRSHYESRYFYERPNTMTSSMALRLYAREMPYNYYISPLLGNKLFRTELLKKNNISFDCYYFEDDVFTFKALLHSSLVKVIPGTKLYYYQRKNSFSRSFTTNTIQGFFCSFNSLREYLVSTNVWEKTCRFFYAYYEKCLVNIKKECTNQRLSDEDERNLYKTLLYNFYSHTDLSEYCKYCDMDLFPL